MSSHRTVTLYVGSGDIGALVARLFDPDRTLPIVVLSPSSDTGEPRVPVEMLSHRFTGMIAVLRTMEASSALSDEVGSLRVFGGAIRVVHPGATPEGDHNRHPVFMTFPEQDPRATADAVVAHLLGDVDEPLPSGDVQAPLRPLPTPAPPPAAVPLPCDPAQPPEDVSEDSRGTPEQAPSQAPGLPEDLPEQVADSTAAAVRHLIEDLVAHRDHDLERAVARERARADAAEAELKALHVEHHALAERFEEMKTQNTERRKVIESRLRAAERSAEEAGAGDPWPPTVYPDDPAAQFRYEVEQRWLMTYSPEERRDYPMQEYTLGPGFIESLAAEVVPARKVVDVCVEVVTQRVWETRRCHPATENGSGSKNRTRASGETAYRANLKSESPGAPRLMWWQGGSSGLIEFAGAAHHDDLSTIEG